MAARVWVIDIAATIGWVFVGIKVWLRIVRITIGELIGHWLYPHSMPQDGWQNNPKINSVLIIN
jgi:hypothetical protein